MSEKQFVGKVTTKQTQYGELINISFGSKDRELLEQTKNDKGWNNLTLKRSMNGNYYLEIYAPRTSGGADLPPAPSASDLPTDEPNDELPF